MKLTKFASLVVLGLILTVAASGCRKRPGDMTRIPEGARTHVGDDSRRGPIGELMPTNQSPEAVSIPLPNPELRKDWARDAEVFKAHTVHFDFDSSTVKSSEKSHVAAVADHLKVNAQDALEIDGHCDERGTEEYNRSLGERRALALREELLHLGIDPMRIDTVSFGKDKPVAQGHDESAWKQNRRGVFLLEVHPQQSPSPAATTDAKPEAKTENPK
jgi:peptidoglycan-associated lipoprotein